MASPTTHDDGATSEARDSRPLPELLRQLTEQSTALARKEVELAKAELAMKGKRFGLGAGAFSGAGLVALYALGAFTAALILLVATALEAWIAALIVGAGYALVAGVLALIGKGRIEAATPPLPEATIESVKEDVEWQKRKARQARA